MFCTVRTNVAFSHSGVRLRRRVCLHPKCIQIMQVIVWKVHENISVLAMTVRLTCLQLQATAPCMPPGHPYTHIDIGSCSTCLWCMTVQYQTVQVVLKPPVLSRTSGTSHLWEVKTLKGESCLIFDPTHCETEKSSSCLLFFFFLLLLEESFSIFIPKCNYRLLNGRRRPNLHTCHISLKADFSGFVCRALSYHVSTAKWLADIGICLSFHSPHLACSFVKLL